MPADTHSEHRSRRPLPRGLVALNAVLLAALAAVSVAPRAGAQAQTPPNRARGEYTLVGGEVSGASSHAIHVIDAANREMVTLVWEHSRSSLSGVGYRDLAADLTLDTQR